MTSIADIVKQQFAGNDVTQEVINFLEAKSKIDLIPYYRVKEKQGQIPSPPFSLD